MRVIRTILGMLLLACSLTTISSLGFMLSCMKMKPVSATVVTVTVLFADNIFRNIPLFDDLKVYFVTAPSGSVAVTTWPAAS